MLKIKKFFQIVRMIGPVSIIGIYEQFDFLSKETFSGHFNGYN